MIAQLATDEPALLALNNAHAAELSFLTEQRWRELISRAFYARKIDADAFLMAFDQNADYDSPNFLWFHARYSNFIYIDRIAVSPAARGRGYARLLYEDLFEEASLRGHGLIVCEVNSDPPNPASDAFHAALEFHEVGAASIHGGAKSVRYFARQLPASRPAVA
ncbi:GNAT family N-acetyltransferase [Terrarubrum flagellatum]|uniref:GNAT family N-acetyltransferase n=1 Tax=Terrirubrum flagellatum TaxID=2895980 RepID=UPI003144D3BA